MVKVRRLLVPVTAAWLLFHLSVMIGTAAVRVANRATVADIICTCAHGADHGACPMHRQQADSSECRLRNTETDLGMALLSMFGPLTLPETIVDSLAVVSSPGPGGYDPALPQDWLTPPDAPPPRS